MTTPSPSKCNISPFDYSTCGTMTATKGPCVWGTSSTACFTTCPLTFMASSFFSCLSVLYRRFSSPVPEMDGHLNCLASVFCPIRTVSLVCLPLCGRPRARALLWPCFMALGLVLYYISSSGSSLFSQIWSIYRLAYAVALFLLMWICYKL